MNILSEGIHTTMPNSRLMPPNFKVQFTSEELDDLEYLIRSDERDDFLTDICKELDLGDEIEDTADFIEYVKELRKFYNDNTKQEGTRDSVEVFKAHR